MLKKQPKTMKKTFFQKYGYVSHHFAHFVVGFAEEGIKNGKITDDFVPNYFCKRPKLPKNESKDPLPDLMMFI